MTPEMRQKLITLAVKWDAHANGNITVDDPYEYLEKLAYRECAKELMKVLSSNGLRE